MKWVGGERKWKRIFSGKTDPMTPESFHSLVDNKGAIIHIIEDEDHNLFGAYSSVGIISTRGNGLNYADPNHFLFTLKNPYSLPPTQFKNKYPETSVTYVNVYGPSYGSHGDLTLRGHDGHFCESHCMNFPWSYEDPTGKGSAIFCGKDTFCVHNMEVFVVALVACYSNLSEYVRTDVQYWIHSISSIMDPLHFFNTGSTPFQQTQHTLVTLEHLFFSGS